MRVRIRYLAAVADYTGKSEEELELEEGSTLGDLLELLREKYPKIRDMERRFPLLVLRNGLNAKESSRLEDGDRIALLPPVSGGVYNA